MNLDEITDAINDHNRNLVPAKSTAIDRLIDIGDGMANNIDVRLGHCEIVEMWRAAVAKVRLEEV